MPPRGVYERERETHGGKEYSQAQLDTNYCYTHTFLLLSLLLLLMWPQVNGHKLHNSVTNSKTSDDQKIIYSSRVCKMCVSSRPMCSLLVHLEAKLGVQSKVHIPCFPVIVQVQGVKP